MSSIVWLTRVFALCALLPRTAAIQEVGKNDSPPASALHSDCYFYGEEGKEINLTPLDGTDDKPRYTTRDTLGYRYSYSPCRSFSLGPAEKSHCYSDVAVCMWASNRSSYQNIGRSSSVRWRYQKGSGEYRLEYRIKRKHHRWEVYVNLECDPSLKRKAKFTLVKGYENTRIFLLQHRCLCEGQCPQRSHDTTQSPGKYAIIGASVSLFLAVLGLAAIFCYFKRKMNHNQRQAADAIGHVPEGIEEPGINNDHSVIRGENSPLLN
ncbi:PREDICTED: uncharacterized protein LOC107354344 isoform X2 [Acropora digitifera]|uniref:uncharacterized protein LOC107354344 isoform X2 n=1 Tax=Acropora digitifera TaxID=70779 RepID=UPI00077B2362|nr:PREDICTED: uncharacterized protein LOC107354344 isoform X2 [Acropora digitifera]